MIYSFEKIQPYKYLEDHLNLGGSSVNGEEIRVSNKYLIRNNKPWIPVMGEIHFSRVDSQKWEEEILKMKAGGITLLSTYVIWIYHNEIENEWNFSDNNDIRRFVLLCKKHDIEVVLRIGPWAHGEVRNGGFPDWLLKKGCKTRCNDSEYLCYVREWYSRISNEVKGLMFADGGNVVAVQLDNELVNNAPHLKTLKEIAKECGLITPIYTVTGWNSKYGAQIPRDEVIPVFGGYPEAPWTRHTKKLKPNSHYFFLHMRNDSAIGEDLISSVEEEDTTYQMEYDLYPFATCELGGGIMIAHHRRPIIKGDDVAAISHVKLGCGNNLPGYYMYHGGTNKIGKLSTLNESKATGYPNDYPIISYDFQAAIGEYGLIRPQYRSFKTQHMFLQSFMEDFAPMESVLQENLITNRDDTTQLRYGMRTNGESGFVFVNNYQRLTTMPTHTDVQFKVTDDLVFPDEPINVQSGAYFMLPFNMKLSDDTILKYSTTQPLCKVGNTYFFVAVEGVESVYTFDNDIIKSNVGIDSAFEKNDVKIVTLSKEQAEYAYKFGDRFFVGSSDMYMSIDELCLYSVGQSDLSYYEWKGNRFIYNEIKENEYSYDVSFSEVFDFKPLYTEELQYGKEKKVCTWSIKTDAQDGLLEIDYVGDVAQIYADGNLVNDEFYKGTKWCLPMEILKGKKINIVLSELNDDIYLETERVSGIELYNAQIIPTYKKFVK